MKYRWLACEVPMQYFKTFRLVTFYPGGVINILLAHVFHCVKFEQKNESKMFYSVAVQEVSLLIHSVFK